VAMLGIFQQIGPGEIILILVVLLLLFGAKRLPEVGKSLGKGLREFKSATRDLSTGNDAEEEDEAPKPLPPKRKTPNK
jgi:sec-independent protein translocase protein TatA